MQPTTVLLLVCLVAVVVAEVHYEHNPSVDEYREALYAVPEHDHSPREKRGLLLLKKKLLLGKPSFKFFIIVQLTRNIITTFFWSCVLFRSVVSLISS